jgi:uncharacterized protein
VDPQIALSLAGLLIGAVFGAVVFHTNYCAMGAISDVVTFGDKRRLRSWLLAIAVAVIGAQLLQAAGIADLTKSLYLLSSLDWTGTALGGLLFGYGMVFAGGCGSKNLVRAGGGDLRAVITLLVMGISAYAAIGGLFGPVRAELSRWTAVDLAPLGLATQSMGLMVGRWTGLGTQAGSLALSALIGLGLLIYCFWDKGFRGAKRPILGGFGVGLSVIAGWAVTGALFDDLAIKPVPPASLTFVRP